MFVRDCIKLAERINHLPPGALYEKTKAREISHARQDAMLLARESGNSISHIGRVFDMDHSTVWHSVKVAQKRKAAVLEKMGLQF